MTLIWSDLVVNPAMITAKREYKPDEPLYYLDAIKYD